jgi:glycosyltransferase involved in cell wall biosynthesis
MRVAIFTDNDFDKVNGVTTTLQAVLRHAPPGIEARVYTAADAAVDRPDYLALESVGVPIPFYTEMKMYVPRVGAYQRLVREQRIDVIHLTTPGPVGLAAMRVARVLRLPMVGSFHTDLAAYARILSGSRRLESVMRAFLRWPYNRCARVLVPSADARRLLAGHGDAGDSEPRGEQRRIAIWRRGVDCGQFRPSRRSAELRRAWRVSRGVPAVLYVGRVSKEKGLGLLPDIQDRLRTLGAPHRFVVVGAGPMLPELKARMHDTVFTGSLGREDVADAFAAADVFLFPSRTDTAGNVILEEQASGLPVLVSDAGGPRENLVDGQSGEIVPGSDPDVWAYRLGALLSDEGRRAAMSRQARRYGEARSWDVELEPLYRTYRELAAKPAPSSAVQPLVADASA